MCRLNSSSTAAVDPPARHEQPEYPVRNLCFVYLLLALTWCETALAGEALMLPAGVYRTRIYVTHAEANSVFDVGGHPIRFSEIYRQALTDSGLPADGGDAYQIETGGKFKLKREDLYLEYGVTSHFGFGAWLQYFDISHDARARLEPGSSWESLPAAQQQVIIGAVNAIDGLDSSAAEWGDTVVGIKHRLLGDNKSRHRFAYNLGIRLPTGHVADPLVPGDLSTGDGQYDAGVWLSFDYQPHPRFYINLQTRHEYQFAGERDVLDPEDPTSRIAMEFQPGFIHYAEIEATYAHPVGEVDLELKLLTSYFSEGEERREQFDPATGTYRGALHKVAETDSSLWILQPHVGFSLLRKKIPVRAYLSYGIPLQGSNVPKAEFWQLRVDLYY